jgi:hypothetical protein
MANLHLILYVLAFVLFLVGAWPVPTRVNLISAGLACLTLTLII